MLIRSSPLAALANRAHAVAQYYKQGRIAQE